MAMTIGASASALPVCSAIDIYRFGRAWREMLSFAPFASIVLSRSSAGFAARIEDAWLEYAFSFTANKESKSKESNATDVDTRAYLNSCENMWDGWHYRI
jgi:hypothetical protein